MRIGIKAGFWAAVAAFGLWAGPLQAAIDRAQENGQEPAASESSDDRFNREGDPDNVGAIQIMPGDLVPGSDGTNRAPVSTKRRVQGIERQDRSSRSRMDRERESSRENLEESNQNLGVTPDSGTTTPEGTTPGATAPGGTTEGTTTPGTTAPGATVPGTTAPGTTAPGTAVPGTTAPRTTTPGATAPGTTAPGTTTPGTTTPGTGGTSGR